MDFSCLNSLSPVFLLADRTYRVEEHIGDDCLVGIIFFRKVQVLIVAADHLKFDNWIRV